MRLYFCDISAVGGVSELMGYLSEDRRSYCESFKNESARLRSVSAYLLLRYALIKEYGIFSAPSFVFNEHSKPFLKQHPGIFFSMSHVQGAVLCAVERGGAVGADIQDRRKISAGAAKKFCTEGELMRILPITGEDEREDELCRLWCLKESRGKRTGKGFSEGFCGIDCEKMIESGEAAVTKYRGYYVGVCLEPGAFPSAKPADADFGEIIKLIEEVGI